MNPRHSAFWFAIALDCSGLLFAQNDDHSPHGKMERIKVHGKALEGNLEGDSPDRDVSICCRPAMPLSAVRTLDQILTSHEIPHAFEIYPGNPVSGIADRVETRATGKRSSHATWFPTSPAIIGLFQRRRAAAWPGTPWAVTGPFASE